MATVSSSLQINTRPQGCWTIGFSAQAAHPKPGFLLPLRGGVVQRHLHSFPCLLRVGVQGTQAVTHPSSKLILVTE